MDKILSDKFKKCFVKAIADGLYIAKVETCNSSDVVQTRIPYVKIDKISNCVIGAVSGWAGTRYIICKRSWYPVLFIYDSMEKTIYSFMRTNRFRTLLNRKDLSNAHYLDTMVEFNFELEPESEQLILDEAFRTRDEVKIQRFKNEIVTMLAGENPSKYVTICYDIDAFKLCKVEAFMSSSHLEIIKRDNWSDAIGVDYNEILDNTDLTKTTANELTITLKPHFGKASDGLDINPRSNDISKEL